jgi:hypothetical protein
LVRSRGSSAAPRSRANYAAGAGRSDFCGFRRPLTIPNVYFHLSMAYAMLRHSGVDVGKMDYLGRIDWVLSCGNRPIVNARIGAS